MTAPPVRTGDLRHYVVFEEGTLTKSASGASRIDFDTERVERPAACSYEVVSGGEPGTDGRTHSETRIEIWTRFQSGITMSSRVRFDHYYDGTLTSERKYFDIESIDNWHMRNQWLRITAKEGQSKGS